MPGLKLSFTKIASLVFLGLLLLGAGCGSQNNSTPQIAFASWGSLDGSNASNNTCTPFQTNHGIIPTNDVNLWGVNASGASLHPLTKLITCGVGVENPAWSPDGGRIAFDSNRALDGHDGSNGSGPNIWLVNADGSGITRLATPTTFASGAVWSPDGSTILFDGDGNCWRIKADGSAALQLTKLTKAFAFGVSWSPDGHKIAFASDRALDGSDAPNTNSAGNIWVMNSDGSSPHPLTSFTSFLDLGAPAWSKDGSKIAFTSTGALDGSNTSTMSSNVWVMNPDGTNRTPLTKFTSANLQNFATLSTWSPDSKRIAYVSGGNVWVVNADGTGNAQLTTFTNTMISSSPSWSPDSKQLVFDSNNPMGNTSNTNIWLVNSDGSGLAPLTKYSLASTSDNGGPGAFSPVWRP